MKKFRGASLGAAMTCAVLIASPATADAAPTTAKPVTLAGAKAALPAASLMPPTKVSLHSTTTVNAAAPAAGCGETITLTNTGEQVAIYTTPDAAPQAKSAVWTIAVIVYASPSRASTDLSRISALYGRCPKTYTTKTGGMTITMTTTAKKSITVGRWKGLRLTRSVVSETAGVRTNFRVVVVELTKGNAIVEVAEVTPPLATAVATQDLWMAKVENLVLGKLGN